MANHPIIIIPARMASTRLPGKPLAEIGPKAMICHVVDRALETALGPVVVAAGEAEIVAAIEAMAEPDVRAILTASDLPSGSDRVFAALRELDPDGRFDAVINLQGDLPLIDPAAIGAVLAPLADPDVDIATLVAEITDPDELANPNVVKAKVDFKVDFSGDLPFAAAKDFSRAPFPGEGPAWHHIGIYAYRPETLARFVSLAPGKREQDEKLEQLRALENGMRIAAARVDTVPFGVDTSADLERARNDFAARNKV